MLRKALEGAAGVSPSSGRVISIYDMLIPSYEFHDIPRTTGMDPATEAAATTAAAAAAATAAAESQQPLVRKTSAGAERRKGGGKVVFDERGSMSLGVFRFPPRCHFPFSEARHRGAREPRTPGRIG